MQSRSEKSDERRNRRVLIVDDEKDCRKVFSSMISLMGFEVVVAEGGDEALNQFSKSPFDLVLTDLNMPRTDGLRLASQIKEVSPGTPIVLLTAEEREPTLKKMEGSSVDLVLFKPFGFKEFREMVQKILDTI